MIRDFSRMVGSTYGRLTVLSIIPPQATGSSTMAQCQCSCGVVGLREAKALANGNTRSCGCLRREMQRLQRPPRRAALTGYSAPPCDVSYAETMTNDWLAERSCWVNMHARCGNTANASYRDYGGRGIKVCDRWASFRAFVSDMGPRPTARHSIDRVDNDGNYEPGNCRWATGSQQQSNTRRSKNKKEK